MTLDNETEVLDETTEEQVDELETVEEEQEEVQAEPEGEKEPEADADEVVVTLGDEPAEEEQHERAPDWVRDLRKRQQEAAKENRELKKQLEALKAAPVENAVDKLEPSLESCEYDEDKFKAEWKAWNQRQAEQAEQERKKQAEGAKAQAEWSEKVTAYQKEKADLKVSDKDEAEAAAFEALSVSQRGILLDAVSKPALVAIALGKNPKRLKELAAITNPIKFAIAVHDLEEKEMKVTPKRTAPLPESTVRGSAPVGGADSTLERLKVDARRSGDYSKVSEYNRKLQAKKSGA